MTGPDETDPNQTGPDETDPNQTGPGNHGDPGNHDPRHSDPGNHDPHHDGPGNHDPNQTGPGNHSDNDPNHSGPGNHSDNDPNQTGPGNHGDPGNHDPNHGDPGNHDPHHGDPNPTGSGARRPAWLVIASRECAVKLRDRGFLISTLAAVAMIAAILGVQAFLISGGEKIQVATSGAGADELLSAAQTLARHSGTDVTFRPREHRTASAVEDAVRAGDAEVGLVRTGDGGWRLIGKTDRNQTAEVWVGMAVQQRTVAANAEAAGTSLAELTKGASVSYDLLTPGDTPYTVTRISRAVFGMLFYLVAILLGTMLATGIVEEKQNRIVEIVASTVSLRSLLLGKIAGLSVIGLGQVLVLGTVGVAGLAATGETGTLHQIAPGIGWFILFFIIGVVVLATLYAAAGAMSSRTEDIQSTTMPITMGVAAVFIASISVTGPALTVLSFLPLASTIAMPGRIVAGDAGWWQPLAALVISLLAAVAIIKMSELIYRRALLQTGGRLSVRQALRTQD